MAKGWSFGALINALRGAAFLDVGTSAGTVTAGDDSRVVNAVQRGGDTMGGQLAVRVNQAAIALRPASSGAECYIQGVDSGNTREVWFLGNKQLPNGRYIAFGHAGRGEIAWAEVDNSSSWTNSAGQSISFDSMGNTSFKTPAVGTHSFNTTAIIHANGESLLVQPLADNKPSFIAGRNANGDAYTWQIGKLDNGANVGFKSSAGQSLGFASNGNTHYDAPNHAHIFNQPVIVQGYVSNVGGFQTKKDGAGLVVQAITSNGGAYIQAVNSVGTPTCSFGTVGGTSTAEFFSSMGLNYVRLLGDGRTVIGVNGVDSFDVRANGDTYARGIVGAGSGSASLGTDGNVGGAVWGTSGTAKAYIDNGLGTKLNASANAVSATKLQTPRLINGVNFDGTSDINLPNSVVATGSGDGFYWRQYSDGTKELFGSVEIMISRVQDINIPTPFSSIISFNANQGGRYGGWNAHLMRYFMTNPADLSKFTVYWDTFSDQNQGSGHLDTCNYHIFGRA